MPSETYYLHAEHIQYVERMADEWADAENESQALRLIVSDHMEGNDA